jgi:hypothetical protein
MICQGISFRNIKYIFEFLDIGLEIELKRGNSESNMGLSRNFNSYTHYVGAANWCSDNSTVATSLAHQPLFWENGILV